MADAEGPATKEKPMSQARRPKKLSVKVGDDWTRGIDVVKWKLARTRSRILECAVWVAAAVVVATLAYSMVVGDRELLGRVLNLVDRLVFVAVGWAIRGVR